MRPPPSPWILVVNDDGIDAPGLVPLAVALSEVSAVRVVVPSRERSWVAKAITRTEPVTVTPAEREGLPMLAVDGYPADCVQLGVHILFESPPAFVVSGINIGYNHGSAFLQSSGTVGAALEASIAGVAAVAFSTGSKEPWEPWRSRIESAESRPVWERLAVVAADLTQSLLLDPDPAVPVSINIPDDADLHTERRVTSIADIGYDRLFREESPGTYVHDFGGGVHHRDTLQGTDIEAAMEGAIAITPIRSTHAIAPAADLAARLRARAKP